MAGRTRSFDNNQPQMSDNSADEAIGDEEAGGLAVVIAFLAVAVLFIGQYIWNIATDLPLRVLANSAFVLITLITWVAIHYFLKKEGVDLHPSRILVSELLPAATFSFAIVFYTYPALVQFIFGAPPPYIEKGVFWSVMQVIGAIMITASTVGWISLLSD